MQHDDRVDLWQLLIASCSVASMASISRHLALGRPVHLSSIVSLVLYSSAFAAAIAALLAPYLVGAPVLLVTTAALSGLGGCAALDLLLGLWRAGGVCIAWAGRRSED